MIDSTQIKKLAEKHEIIYLMVKDLDKNQINLKISGVSDGNTLYIGGACETELKVIQTISNALKELATTYERQMQNIIRKELRD